MKKPEQIGRYQLLEELGRGGMGVVYRALDPRLDREVAVKTILFPARASREEREDLEARFSREARAAASVRHPGVVAIHDYGRDEEFLYLVMELVSGESLAHRIQRGRILPSEAFRITAEVAEALQAAHASGVIHRDVTPRNVLLSDQGRVLVTDFGLARSLTDSNATLTEVGMVVGSPHYVAPERALSRGWDERSDIFSLGVILFELLMGRLPFDAPEVPSILYQVVHQDPLENVSFPDRLGRRTQAMLRTCLQKDPDKRFSSAGDLALEARRLQEQALAEEVEETAVVPALQGTHPFGPKRRRLHWALPLILILACGGVLTWWWIGKTTSEELPTSIAEAPSPTGAATMAGDVGKAIGGSDVDGDEVDSSQSAPVEESTAAATQEPTQDPTPEERAPILAPTAEPQRESASANRNEEALDTVATDTPLEVEAEPARQTVDTVPPILSLEEPRVDQLTGTVELLGRVLDDQGAVELTVDGQPVVPAADGSFQTLATFETTRQTLTITARDSSGNQTVRSVELGAAPSSSEPPDVRSRFQDRGDATIQDRITGILWTKRPATDPQSYRSAKSYCRKLELARASDWMLPTVEELEELWRSARGDAPGQSEVALASMALWSSTRKGLAAPWAFDFGDGLRVQPAADSAEPTAMVLCVRRQERPRPNQPREEQPVVGRRPPPRN